MLGISAHPGYYNYKDPVPCTYSFVFFIAYLQCFWSGTVTTLKHTTEIEFYMTYHGWVTFMQQLVLSQCFILQQCSINVELQYLSLTPMFHLQHKPMLQPLFYCGGAAVA